MAFVPDKSRPEQLVLFPTMLPDGAIFSRCRRYRYVLWRTWNENARACAFILLNPSSATEMENDPTIRRCIGFASRWGFGRLYVLNLFAYRATYPRDLFRATDPIGPENDRYIRDYARRASLVVCAWGNHGSHLQRSSHVLAMLRDAGVEDLYCLGKTSTGEPTHPLYVSYDAALSPIF